MYTYDFYKNTCNLLKDCGFYPNRILDIGANVCETADIMRDIWCDADILLFEGNNQCESIFINKRYKYHIKLLGKANDTVKFYKTKWSTLCSGNSIYRETSSTYDDNTVIIEMLPIYKLDDIVTDIYDLIKLDTQGSELDIIHGGLQTVSKAKVIIVEVSLKQINTGGCSKYDIMNILKQLNFDYIQTLESILDIHGNSIQENLLYVKH